MTAFYTYQPIVTLVLAFTTLYLPTSSMFFVLCFSTQPPMSSFVPRVLMLWKDYLLAPSSWAGEKDYFRLFGITVVRIPFISWGFNIPFPSCGFVYYLVNILVGFVGLVAYTWVAKRYQYLQRDEPDIYSTAMLKSTMTEHWIKVAIMDNDIKHVLLFCPILFYQISANIGSCLSINTRR